MLVFFDTEFWDDADNHRTVPLSMAMVREDGMHYHCVFPWTMTCGAIENPWLRDNVFPSILNGNPALFDKNVLWDFVGDHPTFWAYVAASDTVVLHQLFGGIVNMPTRWPYGVMDLALPLKMLGLKFKQFQTDGFGMSKHDVLDDARMCKHVYHKLLSIVRGEDQFIDLRDENTGEVEPHSIAHILNTSGLGPNARGIIRAILRHLPR